MTMLWLLLVVLALQAVTLREVRKLALNTDALTAAVQDETSVADGLITLATQLFAQVQADIANGQPAQDAIDAAVAKLTAEKQKIADAIVANTPAAP